MNKKAMRNILNSFAQGLLTQEETINAIVKEVGYAAPDSAGISNKERTSVQIMQQPEKV